MVSLKIDANFRTWHPRKVLQNVMKNLDSQDLQNKNEKVSEFLQALQFDEYF